MILPATVLKNEIVGISRYIKAFPAQIYDYGYRRKKIKTR